MQAPRVHGVQWRLRLVAAVQPARAVQGVPKFLADQLLRWRSGVSGAGETM